MLELQIYRDFLALEQESIRVCKAKKVRCSYILKKESTHANCCPLCGKDNNCGNISGKPHGTCWCNDESFPKEIFEMVPPEQLRKACICKECLTKFKLHQEI
ncbi:cysteine-rich CWC family protein [Ectobacillus polymachus]|uniref:cysteine-rich CWC family protein n=1 Tax=Ectobacillus polymachus TaxID=1508806 RepID=UPI003A869F3A